MQVKTGAATSPSPALAATYLASAPESKAAKKDDVEAATAPEETAASASASAPSSVDDEGSSKATGPSPSSEAPSQSDSTDEDKTPVR
jgi:hypothetical protein